ncbi:MAG: YciI family protein [Sporichthyaceae bacterium]
MTQYMISVWHEPTMDFDPAEMEQVFAAVDAFNKEVMAAGQWVFGGGLMPPNSATVVDATGAKVVTTDGPFVETKEMLGGFWVLELPDLDEALKVAERASAACRGAVEVRAFQGE